MPWVLLFLSWFYVWFWIMPNVGPERVVTTKCEIPENTYVITTREKNICKTGTNETIVWRDVKTVKVDEYPMVTDDTPIK
jgi:hypothetical protein